MNNSPASDPQFRAHYIDSPAQIRDAIIAHAGRDPQVIVDFGCGRGIKTLASGGGYGELNLMVTNNAGLYEGSTISAVAIAIVPLVLWLGRFGTIFPADWRTRWFSYALTFACLLMPIGTSARTVHASLVS